jgi:hypothetical protein
MLRGGPAVSKDPIADPPAAADDERVGGSEGQPYDPQQDPDSDPDELDPEHTKHPPE